VSFDGMGDPKAHWLSRSVGRLVHPDDGPHGCEGGACIAIDWHLAILKGWFDGGARYCSVHPSVASNVGMEDRALTLDKCLETFVAEEKISEAYCSKCKEHRTASLKTDFWRLPPVLVVHLKRFQFTAYSRRKLHNLVKFPVDALDLSGYLVKDDDGDGTAAEGAAAEAEVPMEQTSGGATYSLYGVVHHLGAMSSGHYVSSIKDRKTGQWHCFNDNIIVPTSEKEVVSESAYILFYVRNDMAGLDIDDVYPSGPVDEEEVQKMLKKRDRNCAVM
jgi:ubiquitin carboxyl-terminal hydrolase 4/11/15